MIDKKYETPKAGKGDVAHAAVRAGLSLIPHVGGAITEAFSACIAVPLNKRRDEWIEEIAKGVQGLEGQVDDLKPEKLFKNKIFITTMTQATQVAIRNHQKEKLEALRNAVLNSALPNAPDENRQTIFLNFVDRFTEVHLHILKFLQEPKGYAKKRGVDFPEWTMANKSTALELAIPELKPQRDLYDLIVKELNAMGLIMGDSLHVGMTGHGATQSSTTSLGNQFLDFIKEPPQKYQSFCGTEKF